MKIKLYTTIPNEIKRGFISPLDVNIVQRSANQRDYYILHSKMRFDVRYEAFMYAYSNIFIRIIHRMRYDPAQREEVLLCNELLKEGAITWRDAFIRIYGSAEGRQCNLKQYKRMLSKAYTISRAAGDAFSTQEILKSFCIEFLDVPADLVWFFVCDLGAFNSEQKTILSKFRATLNPEGLPRGNKMLLLTPTFRKLDPQTAATWVKYLDTYTKEVDLDQKLLAARGHAGELVEEKGEAYNFLVKACKELLL